MLVLTKANARSTVHRPTHLDYIGIKRYDAGGKVVGEHRFIGLYASGAYMDSPFAVPVLRRKVAAVIERAGFLPASHDYKDLVQILETYPRDDLFQTDVEHLFATAMGILRLQERRRVRLFVHLEPFGRFVSCLVFIPRDRYTTQVRERIAARLIEAYGANEYEWNTRLSDSVLARLHYVLHLEHPEVPTVDEAALETTVAAATRSWVDDLRDALTAARGEEAGLDQLRIWSDAFPPAYQDDFDATETLADLPQLERIGESEPLAARLTIGDRSPRPQALRHRRATVAVGGAAPPHEPGRHRRRRASLRDHAAWQRHALDEVVPPARADRNGDRPRRTPAVRGSVPRGRRRARRGRRASTVSCSPPASRGARSRCCARSAATSARSVPASARPTSRTRWPDTPTSPAGSSNCSSPASTHG